MSTQRNVEWLEAAEDNFAEAISQRNWAQAHAVADDTQGYGFIKEAGEMRRRLNLAQYQSTFKKVRVADQTEFEDCSDCLEIPGKEEIEVEDSYSTRDCRTCEGTTLVPVQVNVLKMPPMEVLRSQVAVIEKGV